MEDHEQKEIGNVPVAESPAPAAKKTMMSTPTSIIVAGVLVALAIVYTKFAPAIPPQPNPNKPTGATKPEPSQVDIKNVTILGEPYVGNVNAPVTMAYWSDYQCPFCKQFETTTFAEIMKNYVDTGKVKVVFKDFAFLGSDSTMAALYERAIWELYPTLYMPWREAMYDAQDDEGDRGFGDETSIKELTAKIAGIDVAKVSKAVTDNRMTYQKEIDADKAEAASFGINGTPGFIVGTQKISGAVPYAQFETAINALLK